MYKHTFTRAKETRRKIVALKWDTKLTKDALKMLGKKVLHHPSHAFLKTRHSTAERESPGGGEQSEHSALLWTGSPGLPQ